MSGNLVNGKSMDEMQAMIPQPDRSVFQRNAVSAAELLTKAPQPVHIFERAEYPETGGIYVYLRGLKYPTKGFPTPEACQANNIAKRMFMGQIRMLVKNKIFLFSMLFKRNRLRWLKEINDICRVATAQYYLHDIRYNRACRQIRKFLETFLLELGVGKILAIQASRNFVTMLEYDNAYLLRVQDLADETTKEKLRDNPIGELKRLLEILGKRDPRVKMKEHFSSLLWLFSLIFKIPKVKRAYYKSLDVIDFTEVQPDDGDRYLMLRWAQYDFGGRSYEDRMNEFLRIHEGKPPKSYIIQSQ